MPVNELTPRERVLFFDTPAVQDVNYSISKSIDKSMDGQAWEKLIIEDPTNTESPLTFDRPLSDNYLPIPNGEIYIEIETGRNDDWNRTRAQYDALAFEGELPCPINVYSRNTCNSAMEFTDEFGPCDSSNYRSAICSVNSSEDIFTGTEGELVAGTFQDMAMRSAKYYADVLAYKVEEGDDGFTIGGGCGGAEDAKKDENTPVVTKSYFIDEQGDISAERRVNYDLKSLHKIARGEDWKLAQECDKLDQTRKPDERHKGHSTIDTTVTTTDPYECYHQIFNVRHWLFGAPYAMDLNKKIYDAELVGKPEPFKPVGTFVDYVAIKDRGNDGTTDEARASWWNASGGMYVMDRSSYTAGLLKYFNPIWERVETNAYSYSAPYSPIQVFVDDCTEVDEGDKLFAISMEGGIKTFAAEMDGYVTYSEGNLHLEVKENKPSYCK